MSQGEAKQELLGEQTWGVGPARDAAALLGQAGPVGGGRRKGSLKDPVSPCISGPFVLFPFTFLPSCYISNRKQNKKQSVFEREWQDLENLKLDACTSLFAGLLGPFAHRLLEPGEPLTGTP